MSDIEVVVVRPPSTDETLECGGHPMIVFAQPRPEGLSPEGPADAGALAGKRYFDDQSGCEVLCSKAGIGALALGGRLLKLREPKALPASD